MHVTSLGVSSHACIQECVDTLRECQCVRKTQSREKHLRRQTLQLLCPDPLTTLVCRASVSTSDGTPRACDGWLRVPLALLDTCVHGLLHFLDAFALCVQLMTHLIEESLHFCKL